MRTGSVGNIGVNSVAIKQIVSSSSCRVRLSFYVDSGVAYITDNAGGAPGDGIPITPSSPLILTIEDDGDLVRHAFFASSLTGTPTVGVIPIEDQNASRVGNM